MAFSVTDEPDVCNVHASPVLAAALALLGAAFLLAVAPVVGAWADRIKRAAEARDWERDR